MADSLCSRFPGLASAPLETARIGSRPVPALGTALTASVSIASILPANITPDLTGYRRKISGGVGLALLHVRPEFVLDVADMP